MTSDIQPYFCPPPLININKKPIPPKFNSFCSIKKTVIITNSSVDNIVTSVWPYLSCPPVGINRKLIPPEFNFPSNVRVTMTFSSVNTSSQPFPFFANVNKDLTYFSNINTPFIYFKVKEKLIQSYFKGEPNISLTIAQLSPFKSPIDKNNKTKTLHCLISIALVGDYIL